MPALGFSAWMRNDALDATKLDLPESLAGAVCAHPVGGIG
jgi:hypothetical protein